MRAPLPVVRAVVALGSRPMGPPVPVRVQRAWFETVSRLGRLPAGTSVERTVLGGRPAERVSAPRPDLRRAVLLLHGGAFTTGSPRTHRVMAAHLAHAAGAPVHVLHYRRAPEHPHPAGLDDAEAALAELETATATAVVGDSAGATLALLLAIRRRDGARPLAGPLALVSPLADLTLAEAEGYRGRDPLLRPSWVRAGRDAFVAGGDARELSPLHLPLHGLPPVLLHVSEHERLRPEGERLASALREAGVRVDVELLPGLWHDVHVHADLVPEAADALRRMGAWLRARTVP